LNIQTSIVIGAAGIIIIALVCFDIFQSILVPRVNSRRLRIAPLLIGKILWPIYRIIVNKLPAHWRASCYRAFAPLAFVSLITVWLSLLICGFACLFLTVGHHIKPPITKLTDALYFAGTSVLTLGFGDVVAAAWPARAIVLIAAMLGLIFMALGVSLLFSMQSYFQQREQIVNTLMSRAGSPASGVVLLLRYRELNIFPSLSSAFLQWEGWVALILESHCAYPLLTHFRSGANENSWLASVGATLDAAALLLTTIDKEWIGEADLYYWMAVNTLKSICNYLALPPIDEETITYPEYQQALEFLKDGHYLVKNSESSFEYFKARRSGYMRFLLPLSRSLKLPQHVWLPEFKNYSLKSTSAEDNLASVRN
jgi:hypothetical protein